MDKKEFLKLEQNRSTKNGILTSAILCYISAGITTILALASTSISGVNFSALALIDVVIILALGLFIHLKQSFPAAVILLAYGLINTIYMTIQTGRFGGWLILLAGISATYFIYKLNKDYKSFNTMPQQPFAINSNIEDITVEENNELPKEL